MDINGALHEEKAGDEEKNLTPDTPPTGSQALVQDHSDGTIQLTKAASPVAEEKRSVTGLKVC